MNQHLAFWKNWQPAQRYIYLTSLIFLFLTILWYLYAFWQGTDAVLGWEIVKDAAPIKTAVTSFQKFFIDFPYDADSYAVTQTFKPTTLQINELANYFVLLSVCVGIILVLTAATYLTTTWYAALIVPVVLYFVSLKLDVMELTTWDYRVPLLVTLLAYLPLSFYFQSFNTSAKLVTRLGSFTLITLLFFGVVIALSPFKTPLIFLANAGMAVPMGLAVLFITLNAHEIIRGILWIVIQAAGSAGRNTPVHFLVVSLIYLANLLYAYFHATKVIDWNIFYLKPLFVLPISLVLGIWGFAKREVQYGNILDFRPTGALLYNGLAIITLATAAFAFATGNDPMVEVLEDAVMFSHIGFGFCFLLYTLSNFYAPLAQNKDVHKVLYQPYRTDYLWVLIGGTVIIAAAVFKSDFFTYQQALAAYNNALGDAYKAEGDLKFSEHHYQIAIEYEFQNHKANYALANLAREQGDGVAAMFHFEKSLLKQPSPQSYASIAELYLEDDNFLKALFSLRNGIQQFPTSGELHNNLALIFSKTDIMDSVVYYLNNAKYLTKAHEVPEANLFAMLAKYNVEKSIDSIKSYVDVTPSVTTEANELVLYNRKQQKFLSPLNDNYLKDSILQPENMCYLYNYTLNAVGNGDTSMLPKIRRFNKVVENTDYIAFLQLAEAMKLREVGAGLAAYKLFRNLYLDKPEGDNDRTKLFGNYLFENNQYRQAAYYFNKAYYGGLLWSRVYEAFSWAEAGEKNKAIEIFQELAGREEVEIKNTAHQFLRYMHPDSLKKVATSQFNDQDNYYYLHFNKAQIDNTTFLQLLSKIQDIDAKFLTVVERVEYYLATQQLVQAEVLRNELTGLRSKRADFIAKLQLLDLKLLYALKRFDQLGTVVNSVKLENKDVGYATFYKAVVAAHKGDTLNSEKLYRLAMQQIPLDGEVVTKFANYYNQQGKTQLAYNVLVDNLQLYADYHFCPVEVYKAYILQALRLNFTEDAEASLQKLFEVVPKAEYEAFYKTYQAEKEAIAKQFADWNS